jgi:acyl-CoA thioesterase FadM
MQPMHRVTFEMTNRPERDGTIRKSPHAAFFLIQEMAMYAWIDALAAAGNDALSAQHFAVVNIVADYGREMFTEEVTFDVSLERVGNSSLTLVIEATQRGERGATVRVVLVRVDGGRSQSTRFTPEEQSILAGLRQA